MTDDLEKLASLQRAAWSKNGKSLSPARRSRRLKEKPVAETPMPECPSWVDAHLVKEWEKVCRAKDEFAAAAHIRNLKKRNRGL